MARFYQADTGADYIDYIGEATGTRSKRPESTGLSGLFGNINALPEDRGRAEEILSSYDAAVNDLATQIRQNPKNINRYAPQLRELGSQIRNEVKFGELAAIQDRYKQYETSVKTISDTFKDSPYLQQAAIRNIKVNPLDFDATSRTFGKIDTPNVVKPFSTEDMQKWTTNAEKIVKDKILSRVDSTKKLDRYNSLYELGEEVGVTEQDVYNTLAGLVTPDMVQSVKQRKDLLGIPNTEDQFFTRDASGNIKPNLTTELGGLMYSVAQGLKRSKNEVTRGEFKDDAGLIKLKASEDRATEKYKAKLEVGDPTDFVDKLIAVTRGDKGTFSGSSRNIETDQQDYAVKTDNFLAGFKFKNGANIQGTVKSAGGQPSLIVEFNEPRVRKVPITKEVVDEKGKKKTVETGEFRMEPELDDKYKQIFDKKQTVVPLDLEAIENLDLPQKQKNLIFDEIKKRNLMTPQRTLDIDPTQDKPSSATSKGKGQTKQTTSKIPPYLQKN